MLAKGFSLQFPCGNGEQYENIGKFWDAMSVIYGRENLCGVGYGWSEDTLCYLIGKIDEDLHGEEIKEILPQVTYIELKLPDSGWRTYHGETEHLDSLYSEIYRDGPLDYEIERFFEDGKCEVRICRM